VKVRVRIRVCVAGKFWQSTFCRSSFWQETLGA